MTLSLPVLPDYPASIRRDRLASLLFQPRAQTLPHRRTRQTVFIALLTAILATTTLLLVTTSARASDDGDSPALEDIGKRGVSGRSEGAAGDAFAVDALGSIEGIRALLKGARYDEETGRFVANVRNGHQAELTLEPGLQQSMERLLRRYKVPYAAVVALEPSTGRILAIAEHGVDPYEPGHAIEAHYPAASVFKVVTGAALLEAGIAPDEEVCYHGGKRRLQLRHLQDDPRRDHSCISLENAMGYSVNAAFGKLALRTLSVEDLRSVAGRFLFNQPVPVLPPPAEVSTRFVSRASIPEDELGFGRTAAGFGEVTLSPMHGALLASAVGNGGLAAVPHLVRSVGRDGRFITPPLAKPSRLLEDTTAAELTRMLEITVASGTARTAFIERRRPVLGDLRIAGKTGSLSEYEPEFRDYSWFVGFAPAEDPEIAVGVVVVNPRKWLVKAPYVAREAMRVYLNAKRRASL